MLGYLFLRVPEEHQSQQSEKNYTKPSTNKFSDVYDTYNVKDDVDTYNPPPLKSDRSNLCNKPLEEVKSTSVEEE